MIRSYYCIFLLITLFPIPVSAQNAQDPSPAALNPQPSQGSPNDTATPIATTDKTKKVWTNENLKSAGNVSVVGDPRNQRYPMTKAPDAATIAKYRDSLQKLKGQLADVNKQLKVFQDFADGKPATEGGRDMSHGLKWTPVDEQRAKLQDQKKQLEEQIDALYEEARKKGIESGMLK
jgi:hypothetical protein